MNDSDIYRINQSAAMVIPSWLKPYMPQPKGIKLGRLQWQWRPWEAPKV